MSQQRSRFMLRTAAALTVLGMPAAVWAQQQSPQYYGPHMWNDGWHFWFVGPVMMIVFLAVAVALVVLLVRWLAGSGHAAAQPAPSGKAPLDILKERFARGEIDKDEFEDRRRTLGD